jgi:TPR repeat protein
MYATGKGVLRDDIEAYKWFTLAIKNEGPNAVKNRDLLVKRMSREQINQGEVCANHLVDPSQIGVVLFRRAGDCHPKPANPFQSSHTEQRAQVVQHELLHFLSLGAGLGIQLFDGEAGDANCPQRKFPLIFPQDFENQFDERVVPFGTKLIIAHT